MMVGRPAHALLFLFLMFSGTAASAESPAASIKIGSIAGLSGEYSQIFQNWSDGITLAQELHNRSARPPRVELFVEDDGFSSLKGLAAYRKLTATNRIDALINGSSPTIGAIAPIVTKTSLPVIQFGEETTDPADDNIFQVMPGNLELERQFGAALAKRFPRNIALFYTSNPTMIRFVDAFKSAYNAPIAEYELDPAMTDFSSLLTQALGKKPECIAILAFPPQGALLVKNLRRLSRSDIPLAFDANFQSGVEEYRSILGDLTPLRDAVLARIPTPRDAKFIELYRARFHKAPGIGADLGFDAFNLLITTYAPHSSDWIKALRAAKYAGSSGMITFDSTGIRFPEVKISTVGELLDEERDRAK